MKKAWKDRVRALLALSLEAIAMIYVYGMWRAVENHHLSDHHPTQYERY